MRPARTRITPNALLIVSALLIAVQIAPARGERPSRDALHGTIEPFEILEQRQQFLRVAGVDGEVTQTDFETTQRAGQGPFAPYDRWAWMVRFDRNDNQTLDWFEYEAYRQDLRRRVLRAFDANGDGRLTAEERTRALAALAAGNIPDTRQDAQPGQQPAPAPDAPMSREELMRLYDKDGDGVLSDEERRAMAADMRERFRQRMLERYDTDGDGVLSDEERAAMREDMRNQRRPWERARQQWILDHFDLDGSGELSDEERAAFRQFEQQLQQTVRGWEVKLLDTDGDGVVSPEERRAAQRRYMLVFASIPLEMRNWMDLDGDGDVTPEEARAFAQRAARNVQEWVDDFTAQFDKDGTGLRNPQQREAFLKGVDAEFTRRIREVDPEGTGDINPMQMRNLVMNFLTDIGIKPADEEDDPLDD